MNAKTYLVGMMFGPVQGFIAAARRTRDLWFGSWLLSEVSKAGAKGLLDLMPHGKALSVKLIFPYVDAAAKLEPESDLSVANKIVGLIQTDNAPNCVRAAKNAATDTWKTLAERCRAKFGPRHIDEAVWNGQVNDMVECYGTWVELGQDYRAALKRLNALLNARKATRDFLPAAKKGTDAPGYGRWKSSLDGARESVLKDTVPDDVRKRFGIGAGEHLDAPGLVKRVLGQERAFTALARVACEPWVRMVRAKAPVLLANVCDIHEALLRSELVSRSRGYDLFPYDGQLIYDFRLTEVLRKPDTMLSEDEAKVLQQLGKLLRAIEDKDVPKPDPYLALLLADGDRMGSFISRKNRVEDHQDISRKLAEFAVAAPEIVKARGGECVYAGGDDVLAFVPAVWALCCAEELARMFNQIMAAEAQGVPAGEQPSLSVGLAFAHFMTPLGTLRAWAKQAERAGKHKGSGNQDAPHVRPRNALGIVIAPRSGAPLVLRGRWDDTVGSVFADRPGLAARLTYWAGQFADEALPDRAAYQLRELARELALVPEALGYEAKRLVARKDRVGEEVRERIAGYLGERGAKELGEEWVAGRWLAKHRQEVTP